ncbi:hypothetical protein HYX16_05015 [Candidatus Woesearchaeota archaeon]|nr:hypothetical protein [Candidatus Woesearchaeota archaeon]
MEKGDLSSNQNIPQNISKSKEDGNKISLKNKHLYNVKFTPLLWMFLSKYFKEKILKNIKKIKLPRLKTEKNQESKLKETFEKKVVQNENDNKISLKNKHLYNVKFVPLLGMFLSKYFKEKILKNIKKIKLPRLKTEKTQVKEVSQKEMEEKPQEKIPKQTKAYKTQFDQLLFLVDKYERITETEVMNGFHISKEIADQWGKVLSENGFIDFYIPIFGDPEFRKKGVKFERKALGKKRELNKLIPVISLILIIVFAGAFIIFRGVIFKEKTFVDVPQKINEPAAELIPFEGPGADISSAFSGKGTYDCRSSDGELRYAIQDSFIKIEKLDGSSKVIIKNNKTYTLNVNTGVWKEGEVREGLSIPGSGNYPKIEMECKEINLTEKEFNT